MRALGASAGRWLQGLLPVLISQQTGLPATQAVSMGAMGDSYYEYLLKVGAQCLLCCGTCSRGATFLCSLLDSIHTFQNKVLLLTSLSATLSVMPAGKDSAHQC